MPKRKAIAIEHLASAVKLIGLRFTAKERKLMLDNVN
jgi:hypothetical protein